MTMRNDDADLIRIKKYVQTQMKRRKLKYRDLARTLDLSIPSIKRLMSQGDISATRLTQIANWLGLNFFELCRQAHSFGRDNQRYTLRQEEFLAANPLSAYIFIRLMTECTVKEIAHRLDMDLDQIRPHLLKLDKIGLVTYWSDVDCKVKQNGPFLWKANGPLEKTYIRRFAEVIVKKSLEHVKSNRFDPDDERDFALPFEFYAHESTLREMQAELKMVLNKYRSKSRIDRQIYKSKDLVPISGLISTILQDSWYGVLVRK